MLRRVMMAGSGPTGDPQWVNVASLLHMDGSGGATAFPDSTGRAWAAQNVTVDATPGAGRFGQAAKFTGAAYSFMSSARSPKDDFGTGDFCIECWVRPDAAGLTGFRLAVCRQNDSGLGVAIQLRLNSGSPEAVLRGTLSSSVVTLSGSSTVPANAYTHIAVTRASGVARLFVNGTTAATLACDYPLADPSRGWVIGGWMGNSPGSQFNWSGWIDEVRITSGSARYTGDFSPRSAPFPDGP